MDGHMAPPLDLKAIRADFPILSEKVRGKPFTFLSQVAFAITGTRWNGLVFFGIRARKPNLKRKGAAE